MNLHVAIRRYKLSALHRQHIMVSICRGLAYMHAADVVHRDVKPSNILLNADLTLVIADLGLARRIPSGGSHLRPSRVGAIVYCIGNLWLQLYGTDNHTYVVSHSCILVDYDETGRLPV